MSTSASTTPSPSLSLNLSDLGAGSVLQKFIQADAKPVFTFGTQISPFMGKPISAVPNGTEIDLSVSGTPSWKTSTGIGFSIGATAKCEVKIVTSGSILKYAPDLSSQATSNLPDKAYTGAFVVFSIDFQVSGSASGTGSVGAVGISGNAKGSTATSVIFAHYVTGATNLDDALKQSLQAFAFPVDPSFADAMAPGDIAQLTFNGSLACSMDVSYGIDSVTFAAPSVSTALSSATGGAATLQLPTGKIAIGADATIAYTHTDDFTFIIQKLTPTDAFLYVMRANKNEVSGGLQLAAKLAITKTPAITVNPTILTGAVNSIAGAGGSAAGSAASTIVNSLNSKLSSAVNSLSNQSASIAATWDKQTARSALFMYKVDLTNVTLLQKSWGDLSNGDLLQAVQSGGLIPQPGSGISSTLDDSFTLKLQLFNFFAESSKVDYFTKSSCEVNDSGDLVYKYNVGKEADVTVIKALTMCKLSFAVSMTQGNAQKVTSNDVTLLLENSASGSRAQSLRIAGLVALLPPSTGVTDVSNALDQYVNVHTTNSIDLTFVLAPAAYGRIGCSSFEGNDPLASTTQDQSNWIAFHDVCVKMYSMQAAISTLNYQDWEQYNMLCNYPPGTPPGPASRRHAGNLGAVSSADPFWAGKTTDPGSAASFLEASRSFMNLCDDLHQLASAASGGGGSQPPAAYNSLLDEMATMIVTHDINATYSLAIVGAILKQSASQLASNTTRNTTNSFTCTLNLS